MKLTLIHFNCKTHPSRAGNPEMEKVPRRRAIAEGMRSNDPSDKTDVYKCTDCAATLGVERIRGTITIYL